MHRRCRTVDFATFNKKIDAGELKGIFRSRLADGLPVDRELPGPDLRQGRLTRNWVDYDNPEFDAKLLAEAAAAPSLDEANALYQEAEAMLAEDFPTAPLWYPTTTVRLVGPR